MCIRDSYNSIGYLSPTDENKWEISEGRKIIEEDHLIEFHDSRRMTQGILNYYNIAFNPFEIYESIENNLLLNDAFIVAEVLDIGKAAGAKNVYEGIDIKVIHHEKLAGFPEYFKKGEKGSFVLYNVDLKTGEHIKYVNPEIIDELLGLKTGQKYLFRGKYDRINSNNRLTLKPLFKDGSLYYEYDGKQVDDPKFKELKRELEVLNDNTHTFQLTGTKDMKSIPFTQESMNDYFLIDGRWINYDDHNAESKVCIINKNFALKRGLEIGSTLSVQFREMVSGIGYIEAESDLAKYYKLKKSKSVEYKVVGIYDTERYEGLSQIYVPLSTFPEEYGESTIDNKTTYSFKLRSSKIQSKFLKKNYEQLYDAGYELKFIDNNAEKYWEDSKQIQESVLRNSLISIIAMIIVQLYIVMVIFRDRKLDYAIERMIGISQNTANRHMLYGVYSIFIPGALIGGGAGVLYAIIKAKDQLKGSENTEIPIFNNNFIIYIVLIIIFVLILSVVIIKAFQSRLNKSSLIDIIQSGSNRTRYKEQIWKDEKVYLDNENLIDAVKVQKELSMSQYNDKKATRSIFKYSLKTNRRSYLIVLSVAGVTAVMIFSLLFINQTIIKNTSQIDKAYNTIQLEGKIVVNDILDAAHKGVAEIPHSQLDNLLKTNLIEDYTAKGFRLYNRLFIERDGIEKEYEIGDESLIDRLSFLNIGVYSSNKLFEFPDGLSVLNLKLFDGYSKMGFNDDWVIEDSSKQRFKVLDESGNVEPHTFKIKGEYKGKRIPILVSRKAMQQFGIQENDRIALFTMNGEIYKVYAEVAGTFDNIASIEREGMLSAKNEESSVIIYPFNAIKVIESNKTYYSDLKLKFKPEINRRLLEYKTKLNDMVSKNEENIYKLNLQIWDDELTKVIGPLEKNLEILEVVYPIIFGLTVVLSLVFSLLTIFRKTRDVAIFRTLGIKKSEVVKMLLLEGLLIPVIGIILGFLVMRIFTEPMYGISIATYGVVGGAYLALSLIHI